MTTKSKKPAGPVRKLDVSALQAGVKTSINNDGRFGFSGDTPDLRRPQEASQPPNDSVVMLPSERLRSNPYNPRWHYNEEKVADRAESIRQHGQKHDVIVAYNVYGDGEYTICDGEYRRRAIARLGDRMVRCRVDPAIVTKQDLYLVARELNKEREDQTYIDDAKAWRKLLDDSVFKTAEELAAHLEVAPGTLSKALQLLALQDELLGYIAENAVSIGPTHAYELVLIQKIAGPLATADYARRVVDENMSSRVLADLRVALVAQQAGESESSSTSRRRETPRTYKHDTLRAGVKKAVVKEFPDSGRVQVEFETSDPEVRARIVEAIASLARPD